MTTLTRARISTAIVAGLALTLLGCASPQASTPAAQTPTPATPPPPVPPPSAPAPASPAPAPAPATPGTDERRCFLEEELTSPYRPEGLGDGAPAFAAQARGRFLPVEEAEQRGSSLAWQAIETLAASNFTALARLVGPEGLCLRASKGSGCIELTPGEVARCGSAPKKYDWPIDSGDDGPYLHTCRDAIRTVFARQDLRHPTRITYNCFPPAGRGNNAAPVTLRIAPLFVELHYAREPWLSLWLVFDVPAGSTSTEQACEGETCRETLRLVEIQAEYWGI